jgi:hypothetical protein
LPIDDCAGFGWFPALSPLGERVDRTGVFFCRGGPGEGVAYLCGAKFENRNSKFGKPKFENRNSKIASTGLQQRFLRVSLFEFRFSSPESGVKHG